jgi:hypothetical protein
MYCLNYVFGDGNRVTDLVDASGLRTLKAAEREAIIIARELAAELCEAGKPVAEGRVEVCDGLGHPVIYIDVRHASDLPAEADHKSLNIIDQGR